MTEVVVCLRCLTDREVESTRGARVGECETCGNVGWASIPALIRDDSFWMHPPGSRLGGNALRAALTGFPFGPPDAPVVRRAEERRVAERRQDALGFGPR